ncbi:glutamate--cysteine ligase [uncultured Vibrio sp.]|uniref:glutamate--cysteine ligase n=1 Tax=uncultured Vibrio sp. TaxID=114054 RepID=UPI002AA940C1|nr:glutamate--cysteine ligase [uncultured Vibrio sp.]
MTTFTQNLQKITQTSELFLFYNRGVERESLRYVENGQLALTPHPSTLGAALTNKLVTTDYSESLLEFITPVSNNIGHLIGELEDIHHFTQSQLGEEKLWPLSMPFAIQSDDKIPLAQYGTSNEGKMKTLYRQGLKNRYGSMMQVISGVHYNFSFPESLWDQLFGMQSPQQRQSAKSEAYFGLIRNYYRLGWLIPYFFGASPAINQSFLGDKQSSLDFEKLNQTLFLPYATSLRLSDLGYTNSEQSALKIGLNSIDEYLQGLNTAMHTPSEKFTEIGVKKGNVYCQLNSNKLQIENELYAPIRPKRVAYPNEKPLEALASRGVEYIEVRSLDVNPYSAVGISEEQIRFLDLFLTWCVLSESKSISYCEQLCWLENWNKVAIEGRKPNLLLQIGCDGKELSLQVWAKILFAELEPIAKVMDDVHQNTEYTTLWRKLLSWIDNPELTISGQLMTEIQRLGSIEEVGLALSFQHTAQHLNHQYKVYSQSFMEKEVIRSIELQAQIEAQDTQSFDNFLEQHFACSKN